MPEMNYDVDAIAKNKKMYPDTYLIGAIHGKGSLPPIIAMMAGQKRKELMTAMQGKQNVKQPTVKDRLAAELQPQPAPEEQMGLAALPAENMQGMGEEKMMAGGGIVAFEDNKNQPVRLGMDGDAAPLTEEQMLNAVSGRGTKKSDEEIKKALQEQNSSIKNFLGDAVNAPGRALQATKDWMYSDPNSKILSKAQAGTLTQADLTPSTSPNLVSQGTVGNRDAYRSTPVITPEMQAEIARQSAANPPAGKPSAAAGVKPGGVGTPPSKGPAQAGQPPAPQDSGIAAAYKDFMGRKDPFAGLGDTDEQHAAKIAEAKNQGLSSFLMNMGAKIMSTTGPLGKAGGEGIAAGMPALENSHKVVRELDNAREQFKFNKAKADELRAQGNIEAAIKYENANTDLMYKTGSLAVEHEKNAMMAPYYAANAEYLRSGKGKNPNELTLDQAAKDFAAIKDPGMKRQLAALGVTDALKYRQYMNTGTPPLNVTGTIPEGAPTLKLNQG